ncbi:hypothetical protein Sme01_35840 [Sphaerisporangium melleum]|uniref:Uncharacterized protein n=1 Tax=Sphaerisporangium melleum TaxID=321316 RepID=A0A917RAA1_9ACTN|nr:helix-turn-helix domain-containing protein [Sphaerisporangium melleum]GGK97328.1 hypothetical protein GCM10007964_44490 [Sphaerisporangium melleum]GII71108.1 hypothetical protein Sme01_35840 [Sphaerisporangium melleum]
MTDTLLRAWATAHARSAGRSGMPAAAPIPPGGGIALADVETWLPQTGAVRSLDYTVLRDGRPAVVCADGAEVHVLDMATGEVIGSWGLATSAARWTRAEGTDLLLIADGTEPAVLNLGIDDGSAAETIFGRDLAAQFLVATSGPRTHRPPARTPYGGDLGFQIRAVAMSPPLIDRVRFGAALRRRRTDRGLSLQQLAALLVVHEAGELDRVERGEQPPTRELARQCDRVLKAGGLLETAHRPRHLLAAAGLTEAISVTTLAPHDDGDTWPGLIAPPNPWLRSVGNGELRGHRDWVLSLAMSGNDLLASGSADGTARVWQMNGPDALPDALHTLQHGAWVSHLAFVNLPHGNLLLATAANDGDVRIWDPRTGELRHTLKGHSMEASGVAWTMLPNGRPLLASCGYDGIVRVWDGYSGARLAESTHRGGILHAVAIGHTRDGRLRVITGGAAGGLDVFTVLPAAAPAPTSPPGGPTPPATTPPGPADPSTPLSGPPRDVTPPPPAPATASAGPGGMTTPPGGPPGPAPSRPSVPAESATSAPGGAAGEEPGDVGGGAVPPIRHLELHDLELRVPRQLSDLPVPVERSLGAPFGALVFPLPADLLAVPLTDGRVLVMEQETGRVVCRLQGHEKPVRSVAGHLDAAGQLLLATAAPDGQVGVWNAETGDRLSLAKDPYAPVEQRPTRQVTWVVEEHERHALAAAKSSGMVAQVEPAAFRTLAIAAENVSARTPTAAAWAVVDQARIWMATGSAFGGVMTREDESHQWRSAAGRHSVTVTAIGYIVRGDGLALVASGDSIGVVRVWDRQGRQVKELGSHTTGAVTAITWIPLPDRRLLLVTGDAVGTLHFHDGRTGDLLDWRATGAGPLLSVSWVVHPGGRVELWATHERGARRYELVVRPPVGAATPSAPASAPAGDVGMAGRALLRLGEGGLWPPLGLVDDLVTLTGGGSGRLHDERLAAFASHPGIVRLRGLSWPEAARAAFAALLAAPLGHDPVFTPPSEATPGLADALGRAMATGPARQAAPAHTDLDGLNRAANAITAQTVTLLSLIGPERSADDPMLALRMGHHAPALPPLSERRLRLLAAHAHLPQRRARRSDGGTPRHTPGTAGIVRHGRPTHLLHTDLALPVDLFNLRALQSQLLYRRHTTPQPPVPRPLTLVLDTTPPTFGPVEQTLRLVGHALVVASWEFGLQPHLITLTDPDVAYPLTGVEGLLRMWTSRTLRPPRPALRAALATAADTSRVTVLLTHQHAPVDHKAIGPALLLVTTRHPAEPAGPRPLSPYHHEVRPEPGTGDLTALVTALLLQETERAAGRSSASVRRPPR